MGEIIYVLKIFGITLVLILIFQIRIGPQTIEHHATTFIQESWFAEKVHEAAQGTIKALRDGSTTVGHKISHLFSKSAKAETRADKFKFVRHENYKSSHEKKVAESQE